MVLRLIRTRTTEGRDRAKARGVKLGRKPKLTERSAAATATASRSLPRGPLLPQYRKNKYNRRNDSASKQNSEFVRGLGITDRREAPMHSWRHYFKTVAGGLIEEQISDAISGHGLESEGRQYGVYELRLMAAEIAKLPNPLAE